MALVNVIGGGLSGCEAALQLADKGHTVRLFEMRDKVQTPAHKTNNLAELVCSNSFKGTGLTSAHGLFKKELLTLGSHLLRYAQQASVKAGESLTVDREVFSKRVEKAIEEHVNIELVRDEVTQINSEEWTLIAAGPLCSDLLSDEVFKLIGGDKLHFFDAIAPVVHVDSIDMNHAFYKNRWEKGDTEDFINCPLDKETYDQFVKDLVEADAVEPKPFEKKELFEGCLPIEEMAKRGPQTLSFGPMRPVGLMHPVTGEKHYAVIQLRAENAQKSLYNMVGFQTRLKWGTQKEIMSKIPALKNAEFARMGVMHRNTFIEAPKVLTDKLRFKDSKVFFSGQIIGAEGYTEAVGTGLYVASQIDAAINGTKLNYPIESCLGSLTNFLTSPNPQYQPMNFNFGLLPTPTEGKKKQRKELQVKGAIASIENFLANK